MNAKVCRFLVLVFEEFCVVEEGEECNVTTRNGGNEAILLLFALGSSILIHL